MLYHPVPFLVQGGYFFKGVAVLEALEQSALSENWLEVKM